MKTTVLLLALLTIMASANTVCGCYSYEHKVIDHNVRITFLDTTGLQCFDKETG
jgi:hypothetical protein